MLVWTLNRGLDLDTFLVNGARRYLAIRGSATLVIPGIKQKFKHSEAILTIKTLVFVNNKLMQTCVDTCKRL